MKRSDEIDGLKGGLTETKGGGGGERESEGHRRR